MSDSVQVAIKVRPLIQREKTENLQIQWAVVDNVLVPTDPEKKRAESGYKFDHIFGPEKNNEDVFNIVVQPIVDAAVNGFNGTVFAYGQTSSGKTHTMMGIPDEPGIIPMAIERMFNSIDEANGREFLLRVSYIEIYNEKVNDLLDTNGTDLKLREDSNGLVQVLRCKEEIASSPEVIMSIMKKGDKNRRIGETEMNERSSRSHSIFRITIESRDVSSDSDGAVQVSQLNLVDLAGSERARQTNATGERFKEGTHINMSLSTLGLVIKQLSESSDGTKYINFRDSKLTRLLQASLGGNAMTTIICAVTPAAFEETQCTLWFASRAKSVKNKPQLNEVMSDAALLKRYKKQLAKLNEELDRIKQESRITEVQEMESKLQEKEHILQEKDRVNQILEERIQLLRSSIVSTGSTIKDENNGKISRPKRRRTWAGDGALSTRFNWTTGQNLPTIKEVPSPTRDSKPNHERNAQTFKNARGRKSIIQTVDLNNESFDVAFTDFELELIQVEKERTAERDKIFDFTDDKNAQKMITKRSVKFQDDIEIHRLSTGSNWSEASVTPEKTKVNSNEGNRASESPGTPKSVLRERITYLAEELQTLAEFTTLEKQVLSAQNSELPSDNERAIIQNTIDKLLSEKEYLFKENAELKSQKEHLFKENTDLKSEKEHLFKENTELKSEKEHFFKENTELKSQVEHLFKETAELKKKITDESAKLKNADTLINTLRSDTDCLMEKIIHKNRELATLKERIASLEKLTKMEILTENSVSISTTVKDECKVVSDSSEFNLSAKQESVTNRVSFVKPDKDGSDSLEFNLSATQELVTNRVSFVKPDKDASDSSEFNLSAKQEPVTNRVSFVKPDKDASNSSEFNLSAKQEPVTNRVSFVKPDKDASDSSEFNLSAKQESVTNRVSFVKPDKDASDSSEFNLSAKQESVTNRVSFVKPDKDASDSLEFNLSAKQESVTDTVSFVKPDNLLYKDSVCISSESTSSIGANTKNCSKSLTKNCELESSSIFANMTYFDNMEFSQSVIQDCTTLLSGINESKDISNITANTNLTMSNDLIENKSIPHAEEINVLTADENIDNVPITLEELEKVKADLEKDNETLSYELQKKNHEIEEIQKVVSDFKLALEKLQETIIIQTNENMDLSRKLFESKEIADDEMRRKFLDYDEKLKLLQEENIVLSTELMEKIEELEKVKESKVLMYDHECIHKNRSDSLTEKVELLEKENIKLSSELTDQIEKYDKLKETTDLLKQQVDKFSENLDKDVDISSNSVLIVIDEDNKLISTECTDTDHVSSISALTVIDEENKLISTDSADTDHASSISALTVIDEDNKLISTECTDTDHVSSISALTVIDEDNKLISTEYTDTDHVSSISALTVIDEENKLISTDSADTDHCSIALQTSQCDESSNETNSVHLTEKIKCLEQQVEHLKLLNEKLGELKLPNCSKCASLKELNESRRKLKLEVKSLTQKLSELQQKFEQKCSDTEILRMKAKKSINESLSLMDTSLNDSAYEECNVSAVENKVKSLYNEIEELKENHNKLSNQYNEKCNELELLQLNNSSTSTDKKEKRSKTDSNRKMSVRIQTLHKDLENLSSDLQELKKFNSNIGSTLIKLKAEQAESNKTIESLKSMNEELKNEFDVAKTNASNSEERIKLLEEELAALYKRVEVANITEKEIQVQKLEIEVQLEMLLKEKAELTNLLQDSHISYEKKLDELQKLEEIVKQLKLKTENNLQDKLQEEIDGVKSRIIQEIKSLSRLSENELKNLPERSVTELLSSFLKVILSKETEIIKRVEEEFERKKRKLEEEKQQSIDAEKRAKVWAKTVETDLEKLQIDFTEQEQKNQRLCDKIHTLKENLKEAHHDNQQLRTTIAALESDMNSLAIELDKKSKRNDDSAAQEKEKLAKNKEEEWENRLKAEKEHISQEIDNLKEQLHMYKTVNDDLRSTNQDLKNTNEGLDYELEHLRNTIEIKTKDFIASTGTIEKLKQEIECLEEINRQLKIENEEKDKKVDEITDLLKTKCDLLDRYKTKVETITPEYENLKVQILERKLLIEKYKDEIHNLKMDSKNKLESIQDKLTSEEIKSSVLNEQIAKFKYEYTALSSTIIELKDRCTELERENKNLNEKVKKSTSDLQNETEMQEMQNEIRSLKIELEGSYNRIKELKTSKSLIEKELMEVHGKNELLEQELNTTKAALESLREKYNNWNIQTLLEKNELLMREKHNIILEIEEKNMIIANKEQQLVELENCKKENAELSMKNKELNEEMDDLASEILQLQNENAELQDKIITERFDKERCSRLVYLEEEYEKIQINLRITEREKNEILREKNEMLLQLDNCKKENAEIIANKEQQLMELENCKKENAELTMKNKELNEEMDDLASEILQLQNENAELQDKIITEHFDKERCSRLVFLEEEYEKLQANLRTLQYEKSTLQNKIIQLHSEKELLQNRIKDLNDKIVELESVNLSRNSSKSNSPTTQKGRRQRRRSEIFNQNRNINIDSDGKDIADIESQSIPSISTPTPPLVQSIDEECRTCVELGEKVRRMSLELLYKESQILIVENTLELKSSSYQMKCKKLETNLLISQTRNSELILEIQNLQNILKNCNKCNESKLNKRDQAVQVNHVNKIQMTGMSSGIVDDYVKIEKLEKEKSFMKDLCRSRLKKIKELENRIKELES